MKPVHPGNLDRAQSVVFFRANDIKGKLVRSLDGVEVRAYTCATKQPDGSTAPQRHIIVAHGSEQHG
jgi:hypothetical protein